MDDALPRLDAARAFTTWHLDPWAAVAAVVLAAAYLTGVSRVLRTGGSWSPVRTAVFLVGGLGTGVVATCSSLAVYREVLFWPAALANTLLAVVVPLGIALGDPVGLVQAASPLRWGPRVRAALTGRLARLVTFPLVSALLGALTQFAVYFTPYFRASLRSSALHELLSLHLVGAGLLFAVPLLADDLLPAWCTHPVRAAITFVDGLIDAVPGMLLALSATPVAQGWYVAHPRPWGPTPAYDQSVGGALVFCVTEAVGTPLMLAVLVQWSRADAAATARAEGRLAAPARVGDRAAGPEGPAAPPAQLPADRERPWWETDPGPLTGRRYDRP